jgi:hypothetical protein
MSHDFELRRAKSRVEECEHNVQHTLWMIDNSNRDRRHFMMGYSIVIGIIACGISMVIFGANGLLYGLGTTALIMYGMNDFYLRGEYGTSMPELQKRLEKERGELEQARSSLDYWKNISSR